MGPKLRGLGKPRGWRGGLAGDLERPVAKATIERIDLRRPLERPVAKVTEREEALATMEKGLRRPLKQPMAYLPYDLSIPL